MAHEDYDRQPRWNTSGYWTDRREGENWQGDRSNVRKYDRDDIRHYNQRSQEQAERLRHLRGHGREVWSSQLETDAAGIHDEHALDFERYQGQDWGYDRDVDPRDMRRGEHRRRAGVRNGARRGASFAPPPYPERRRQVGQRAFKEHGPDHFQIERGWVYPHDRNPGDNLTDNYWGRREMDRDYYVRNRDQWWNNEGGRSDMTSARQYRNDLPTRPRFDWMEEPDFDLDPGYEYEFGTDYDMLDDFSREVWNVPGPYAGVGPADYQPSDERIKENICERFTRNGRINCSRVQVQVENGQVTLKGSVNRREEKYLAEDIALSIGGVKDVDNQIRYK